MTVEAGICWGAMLGLVLVVIYALTRRTCPHCREHIDLTAKVCPKCGRDLPSLFRQPARRGRDHHITTSSARRERHK